MEADKQEQSRDEALKGAALLTGASAQAVHQNGESVYFRLQLKDTPDAAILADYQRLAGLIHYLQRLAVEARQRRMAKGPEAGDMEAAQNMATVVEAVDVLADPKGETGILCWASQDGVSIKTALSLKLLRELNDYLPQLIREMERRQAIFAVRQ